MKTSTHLLVELAEVCCAVKNRSASLHAALPQSISGVGPNPAQSDEDLEGIGSHGMRNEFAL